ncbi:MAG: serine/threonine protein kinase [Holophagales bacterium]|nr:serine/threonine protein kinase [Holophagales bacterium]MBK9965145.1 serine/threonine protein kinase [Holophagales bacterium]
MPAPLSPERWRAIRAHFDEAMELPDADRSAFVAAAFPGDDDLRAELAALVDADTSDGGLLDARSPIDALLPDLGDDENGTVPSSPSGGDHSGSTLGPYRLVREIGRGGMGAVYLAERSDGEFLRQVAVKVLRPGSDGRESERRFRQERQILARLEHPAIARLLDGGTSASGTPYLVMELVAGEPCTDYCRERQLGVADRLQLFLEVASAVQYAHQQLVVHRDLKPSNIFVTPEGRVKLLDFGIARLLEDEPADAALTATGRQVLTLRHASPEQVRGEPVTTASDVYSLGVLLYELLAGRSPYGPAGGSRATLERAVLEAEPAPPSSGGELSRDLDAIVLKALRKEPAERYSSVEAFARDVRNFLEGRPVTARRGTLRYRAARFTRRHAVSLAAAGIVVGLFFLAGILHTQRLARERSVARREAEKAFLLTDFAFSMVEGASRGREEDVPAWLPAAERQARAWLRVDPEVGAALLRDVARLRLARKELDAAARLLDEVQGAQGSIRGLGLLETAETLRVRGKLAQLEGRPEEAAREYETAFRLFRETLPSEGGRAVQTIIDLGNAFLGLGRLEPAADAYRRAIELLGASDVDPQWGRARNNLGVVAMRRGDWAEAARLMGEALPNVERSLDESDPELGEVLVTFAQVLDRTGDHARARVLAARGLELYEKTLPPGDPRLAEARELAGKARP